MPVFCHRNMQATSRFYLPLLFVLLFSTVNQDGFKPNLETHLHPLLSMKPEDTSLESNSKEKNSALSSKAHHHRLLMQVAVLSILHSSSMWRIVIGLNILWLSEDSKPWISYGKILISIPKTKKKHTWQYWFNWCWPSYKKHLYLSDYHSSIVVVVLY